MLQLRIPKLRLSATKMGRKEENHCKDKPMIQQILFAIVAIAVFGFVFDRYSKIYRNIMLGTAYDHGGNEATSIKNMMLVAFGQKKMFKRIVPAILHMFVYVAFLITQIELIEILVDGFFGKHRFFRPIIGPGIYGLMISFIEILSVLALVATFAFLARRNLLKLPRFHKDEMTGWPKLDGNMILILEIILVTCIFTMNGADEVLYNIGHSHAEGVEYHEKGSYGFAISQYLGPLVFGWFTGGEGIGIWVLELLERIGWWGHILVVFLFLAYLPISKHLHIMLAFPNTYFAPQNSRGEMENMPDVMQEVKMMMGLTEMSADAPMDEEMPEFGAKDVFGLSWKNILDAYTCTECGRCTSVCPANMTGKKLSPRKIVMDVRDRAEEVGMMIDSGKQTRENYDDGKSLFDYISREEIHACTTCNACVEACPVMISPLDPILKLRRYEILTESAGPSDWVPMFTSIENGGSPWQVSDARDKWATDATNG